MTQLPHDGEREAAPAGSKASLNRGMRVVGVLALLGVVGSFLSIVFWSSGRAATTTLVIIFFFSCLAAVFVWRPLWKSWRHSEQIAGGATAAAAATVVVLALLDVLPSVNKAVPPVEPTIPVKSSTPTTSGSASPSQITPVSSSATATVEPSPISSQPRTVLDEGTVKLKAHSSVVIKRFQLHIVAEDIVTEDVKPSSRSAYVRLVTDDRNCEDDVKVGHSIVMTDRAKGAHDYWTWYQAYIDQIGRSGVRVSWTVGTGRAPQGSWVSCGVDE
jgi:hypothetical protein